MLVVKAGRDVNERINESIDRFAAAARDLHADVRVITNAKAPHGFDLGPRTARSKAILRETLRFLRARLARPLKVTESCATKAERAAAFRFFAADDTRLVGVALGSGSRAIVLAHGSSQSLCEWLPYARKLAGVGYRAVAYDSRPGIRADLDIPSAVEALRRTGSDHVFVAGSSLGALAALVGSAALRVQPAGVVSLSAPDFVGPVDARAAVLRLRVPIFFAAGEDDQPFADDARELYAAAVSPDKRLEILPGGRHGVDLLQDPAFRGRVTAFLAMH
jgi:pimeloyl-ACP methyl ester carboxylesterase